MRDLTGTGTLIRFLVRRDRARILVWVGSIVVVLVMSAASVKGLYPTQADLDKAAEASRDNAAAIAFNGPDQGLDTMGGQVAFQISSFGMIVIALMSVFMVGRETRGEEESGRAELVRSMAVGRHAPATATFVVVAGMNLAVGLLVALGLLSLDLPTTGSLLLGVSFSALGLVFAGIAVLVAQVTENTRVVYGLSGAVLGAAFALRAAGDVGDGTLSWLSPIGWSQKARPYAGDEWWPLLLLLGLTLGSLALAALLASRRDLGAGLVAPRPGPPVGAPSLGTPWGLALRLQRGTVVAWSAGLFFTGVAYGAVADDVEDLIGDNETVRDMIARAGGVSLTDSYLSTSLLMLALVGAGFAISSALRARSEETALRAEPLLATPLSRVEWLASHAVIALVGAVVVLAAAGFGTGLAYGLAISDLGQVPRLVGASLAYTPALWALTGLALALYGVAPRAVSVAWAALAAVFVIGILGEVFDFPSWVNDLSPFEHIPQVPGDSLRLVPPAIVAAVAAALATLGFTAFRHRDIG